MESAQGSPLTVNFLSLYDGSRITGRVYLPVDPYFSTESRTVHAAVVPHPYAPLGGSQDDPVVLSTTNSLLELGFIVGTFDFRGSNQSGGRSSWTGRPEQQDYRSLLYFLAIFAWHYRLKANPGTSSSFGRPAIALTLAGHSYGSLVASRTSAPKTLQDILPSPDELDDQVRKNSVGWLRDNATKLVWGNDAAQPQSLPSADGLITSSHLLISPLLPPAAGFVAALSGKSLLFTNMDEYKELATHPTLAVWGEKDGFTADKRLKKWAEILQTREDVADNGFQYASVPNTDHFWRMSSGESALPQLRLTIRSWVASLASHTEPITISTTAVASLSRASASMSDTRASTLATGASSSTVNMSTRDETE